MAINNANLPISPLHGSDGKLFENPYDEGYITQCNPMIGLTKREYFAALAMQGLLANHGTERRVYHESVASEAVKSADALLNELSKPQP